MCSMWEGIRFLIMFMCLPFVMQARRKFTGHIVAMKFITKKNKSDKVTLNHTHLLFKKLEMTKYGRITSSF